MRCAHCNKPIRKYTTTVYIRDEPTQYDVTATWCRYHYLRGGARPQSIADCRKLTNQTVVSTSRNYSNEIASFNEWDGEHYFPSYGFFCSNNCASEHGRLAVSRGLIIRTED
jgi:hypothetical protein